ncbi:MAG TPA: methyltransferase domain-containing protein [Phenylobacterium sp.]|jgi:SAM-dependent methyltransferase|uniref:class I SAM-dependent methyltransferase n=1 Tax=Phenylobacterium sp. TaxID=1871053 RepID=UPI002CFCDD46|nr:methyltransferase domain-containing protein [Phenylobacterium sp.]HXA39298.1 methyltransferase domain-containing protein [Phenylobacterium sp.]
MTTRPYYAEKGLSAAFYDTVTAADTRLEGDLDAYARLAPAGGTILELGVGTGRLAFGLAERGFSVVGVDIAPAMLAQAAAKQAELSPALAARVELRRGDMTALDLKRTFDLVICPYFTLAHMPRGMAWKNTFATASRHLKAGGLAAFHLPLVDIMRLPGPPESSQPVLDEPIPTGGRLLLFVRERSFREDVCRLDQVIEYVELDARGQALRQSSERLTYYHADPAPLAAPAGLTPDREPVPIGGVGEIHVFIKA